MSKDLQVLTEVTKMSSLEIAELCEKKHYHVLRDINKTLQALNLIDNPYMDCKEFQVVKRDDNGQTKYINLNKELSIQVVAGYEPKFLQAIIKRWQELEASNPKIPKTYGQALILAGEQQIVIEEQQAKIKADKPKVDFADTVISSTDNLSMNEFAKLLSTDKVKIGHNKLMAYLRKNGFLQHGRTPVEKNIPYQPYIDKGWFEVKWMTTSIGKRPQSFITPKGQIKLRKQITKHFSN